MSRVVAWSIRRAAFVLSFGFLTAAQAGFFSIDFDEDEDGNAMVAGTYNLTTTDPYANLFGSGSGVHLSTDRPSTLPLNLYDSESTGGEDPDLERDNAGTGEWDGGSELNTVMGNLLIVNETTNLSVPDDNGSGGEMILDFDIALTTFAFEFVDLDTAAKGTLILLDTSTGSSTSIPFAAFEDGSGSVYENANVLFGDRHANNVTGITAAKAGLTKFDRVTFKMTGSGGIGSASFTTVPEAGCSLAMLLLGSLLTFYRRRRPVFS